MKISSSIKILLTIIISFLLIVALVYFFEDNKGLKEVTISNLSSNSVSISWVTTSPTFGSIEYSKNETWFPLIEKFTTRDSAHDDRNVVQSEQGEYLFSQENAKERTIHHVTIRNLEPETQYYFRINGNIRTFKGEVSSFRTLALAEGVSEPDPIYGLVDNFVENEAEPSEGIVLYRIKKDGDDSEKSMLYSSIISSEATWSGDLSLVRDSSGNQYEWNEDNYVLETETKTPQGYGWNDLSLLEYKPVGDIIVNLRYIAQ